MGNENINNNNLIGGFAPSIPGLPKKQNITDGTAEFGGCVDGIDWKNNKIEKYASKSNDVIGAVIRKYDEIHNTAWDDPNNPLV